MSNFTHQLTRQQLSNVRHRHYILFAIAAILCFSLCPLSTLSQTKALSSTQFLQRNVSSKSNSLLANTPYVNAQSYKVDVEQAQSVFLRDIGQKLILRDFPIRAKSTGTIELTPARPVIDGRTEIFIQKKNGTRQRYIPEAMMIYHGKISGDDQSQVVVSYCGTEMYCSIQHGDGTILQIAPSLKETKNSGNHFLSGSELDIPTTQNFTCSSESTPNYHHDDFKKPNTSKNFTLQGTDLLEVEIAFQVDRFAYKTLGNDPDRVTRYVNSILAMVSMVYEKETNCGFTLSSLILNTEEDPDQYNANSTGDISTLLGEMRSFWDNFYTDIPRDIAHLLTNSGRFGVGGIAFRDQLCDKSFGYGVSGIQGGFNLPMVAYNWDSFVVAHEIGHNFQARHTHDCWWSPPLDSCVSRQAGPFQTGDACLATDNLVKRNTGSIMSYCHLRYAPVRYTFLPPVAQVIREGAEKSSICIKPPANPQVRIVYPIGGSDLTLRGDTTITIQWLSSGVNSVNVEYSLDSGSTWTTIEARMSASTRNKQWKVPSASANRVRIRVYNSDNQIVGDTTYTSFRIATPQITILNPGTSARLPRNERTTIRWQKDLVSGVNLFFSATGSDPWIAVASNQTGTNFDYVLPDIETTTARIRAVDAATGTIIGITEPFAIGTPFIKLNDNFHPDKLLCQGNTVRISWTSDFVNNIQLRYSATSGNSFPLARIIGSASGVSSSIGFIDWVVPAVNEDSVKIRAISLGLTNATGDTVDSFYKMQVCLSVEDDPNQPLYRLNLQSISPNPATNDITLALVNNSLYTSMQCVAIDNNGREFSLGLHRLSEGESKITLPVGNLSQGRYILAVRANGGQRSLPFMIVR